MSAYASGWAWRQQVKGSEKLILVAIADESNDDGMCETGTAPLAAKTGVTRQTVGRAIEALETAGLIVRERLRGGSDRRPDRLWLQLADGDGANNGGPDVGAPSPPPPPSPDPSLPRPHTPTGKSAPAREAVAKVDQKTLIPDGFPDELRPHAREVMAVLKRVAEQHGAKRVWPRAVGLAIMAHPRHPLVKTAHALEGWAVDPGRQVKDVVSTYRTFLGRESELEGTERLAADGVPSAARPTPVAARGAAAEGKEWRTRRRMAAAGLSVVPSDVPDASAG